MSEVKRYNVYDRHLSQGGGHDFEEDSEGDYVTYTDYANRIKELESQINFLVQSEMLDPSPSYRGWLIQDESGGHENFWYAYTHEWESGDWNSPYFMMVSGNFDDVLEAVDCRIKKLKGQTDEPT